MSDFKITMVSQWVRSLIRSAAWTHRNIDYSIIAHEAEIIPTADGKSQVRVKSTGDVLGTFADQEIASTYVKDYNRLNLVSRKPGGKLWELYGKFSEEGKNRPVPQPERKSQFEIEQAQRDNLLSGDTWENRRSRHKKLIMHGEQYIPIMRNEIREFREKPARPHGVELPAPKNVPDVPSVKDLILGPKNKLVAWVRSNCKFANMQGEWWIDDGGQETYADGDTGDYNHAMIAFETALGIALDDPDLPQGIAPMERFSPQGIAWLQQNGSDPAAIKALAGGADPRDYMMKRFNWIRVAGDVATCWTFDQGALTRLGAFVEGEMADSGQNPIGSMMVEEFSTHETWNIPYEMLIRPGVQVEAVKHISSGVGRFR